MNEFLQIHKKFAKRVDDDAADGWTAEQNGTQMIRYNVGQTIRAGAPTDISLTVPLAPSLLANGPPRSTTYC